MDCFGQLVFGHLKKLHGVDETDATDPSPISDTEKDALQYVAGYVVHKFLKKLKNNPTFASPESQSSILISESMIDVSREKLVGALIRGGLISISSDCELIFYKTEEKFRKETTKLHLCKVNVPEMASSLICQPDIISLTNNIVQISGRKPLNHLKKITQRLYYL